MVLTIAERDGIAGDFLRPAGAYREAIAEAYELIERTGLGGEALKPVTDLAYGRQRMTEIAVALALKPKVLLLDEPAAGVPAGDTGTIIELIERLPADIAVLLIDHDMDLVFRIARRITVLVSGRVLVEGPPDVIARDPTVRQVYLGERKRP
jgi:ABC-type branched-subunit amino acid transport system ATPase component